MATPPFTEQHREILAKALADIREARTHIENGTACGMNCQQDQEMADYLEQALLEYQRRYFSGNTPIQAGKGM